MTKSDEQLLAAIAEGPGALPEFYRRHVARVIGIGARRFAQAADVADFTAEVFLEVMTSAASFDPHRGRAVPWLYGLASNVAARMHRQHFRERDATIRLAGRALLDDDDHLRVEQRIDAAHDLRDAYHVMAELPPDYRRILEFIAIDGLTLADAARALGIGQVAARVRLSRARQRMRSGMPHLSAPNCLEPYRVREESA